MTGIRFVLLLTALALAMPDASRADKRLEGIACRSVHLGYSAPACDVFVNSVTVEKSAPGTYFCVCGFGKGYYGIQQLANDKRLLIFSVWDPGEQNDPNAVEQDRRVKLLHRDEKVRIGRFGNEGTGGQSFLDYDWKDGETYHFAVSARVQLDEKLDPKIAARQSRTEYTSWFLDPETERWRKLVTFSTLAGGRPVTGCYSFVEDFRRDRVSTTFARRAEFGPVWVRTGNEWRTIDEARFTGDSNPAKNIDAGPTKTGWFLATGGRTANDHTPLGDRMKSTQTEPPAFVTALGELLSKP